MNTTTSVVGTGIIVAVGKWAKDETLSVQIAVGVAGVAIALSLLNEADEKLASGFAALILLLAAFMYLPAIVKKLGFAS